MIEFAPLEIGYVPGPFDLDAIAKADQDLASEIYGNLSSLIRFGEDFGAAVQLFDFATFQRARLERQIPPAWFRT